VNINVVGLDLKNESTVDAPFGFTVNYNPSIAQLSVKGRGQVSGEKEEISKMMDEHKQNGPPPVAIMQAVSSVAMADAILMPEESRDSDTTFTRGPAARTNGVAKTRLGKI